MDVSCEEELARTLRAAGRRVTPQRLVMLRALREMDRHASAEEVLRAASQRLPGLSAPTVYATLELFEEMGLVRRVSAGPVALFDPRPEPHHHFACRVCGAVTDLQHAVDAEPAVAGAAAAGHLAEGADVVVSGVCQDCRAASS